MLHGQGLNTYNATLGFLVLPFLRCTHYLHGQRSKTYDVWLMFILLLVCLSGPISLYNSHDLLFYSLLVFKDTSV